MAAELVEVDLSLLPSPLVRRVLDAFTMEFYAAERGSGPRLALRVSAYLHSTGAAPSTLSVDVDDDWPVLTSQAARALLHLMIRVADRRDIAIAPRGA